jgi:hypothetical protein
MLDLRPVGPPQGQRGSSPRVEAVLAKKEAEVVNSLGVYGVNDALFQTLLLSSSSSFTSTSTTASLTKLLSMHQLRAAVVNTPSLTVTYTAEALADEIESLAAIYPHTFRHSVEVEEDEGIGSVLMSVDIDDPLELNKALSLDLSCSWSLEVYISPTQCMPPLPLLRLNKPKVSEIVATGILQLQFQLWKYTSSLEHPPIIYDLLMFIGSTLIENSDVSSFICTSTAIQILSKSTSSLTNNASSSTDKLAATFDDAESIAGTDSETRTMRSSRSGYISFWDRVEIKKRNTPAIRGLGNTSLPAFKCKGEFLDMVELTPAIVVTGETGSGQRG